VTSLWADQRVYWPVQVVPYTPASRLAGGERDPRFKTKPQLATELVQAAGEAGMPFRAVVADCFSGDNPGLPDALVAAEVPFVLASSPARAPGRPPRPPTRQQRPRGNCLARRSFTWPLAAHPAALPRRPHRDLVGGRRHPRRLGSGAAAAAGGGHHRPRPGCRDTAAGTC
jgi:DDE superfamily endonuclease